MLRRFLISFTILMATMAALIFVPAGTVAWWQAWLFLGLYALASIAISAWLAKTDPALLQRRMRGGPTAETEPAQRVIMTIASAGFVGPLVVAGLDHRFGWSHLGSAGLLLGDGLMLLGWIGIWFVFRANSFAAATIRVEAGQRVISTGPYAVVRHPMYAAALPMLAGIPIALGSRWALLPVLLIVPALVWRMLDEERVLVAELPGYAAYRDKVRYRLIPGIW